MIAPPLSFSLRVTRRPLAHRRVALLPLPSGRDVADAPISASEGDYVAAFARFLSRNVAAGNPADDTRATYGDSSQEYQSCLASQRSGGRTGGGSYGGFSTGGSHK